MQCHHRLNTHSTRRRRHIEHQVLLLYIICTDYRIALGHPPIRLYCYHCCLYVFFFLSLFSSFSRIALSTLFYIYFLPFLFVWKTRTFMLFEIHLTRKMNTESVCISNSDNDEKEQQQNRRGWILPIAISIESCNGSGGGGRGGGYTVNVNGIRARHINRTCKTSQ